MSSLRTITLVSFILTCISIQLSASHILGGEASYRFINHNDEITRATYEITFIIYRDQDGIELESTADFGIYEIDDNGHWLPYEIIENIPISTTNLLTQSQDNCGLQLLDNKELETGVYTFQVTLPVINNNYKIAFQRCCRNHNINNIKDPGLTGVIFDVEISAKAQKLGINSPRFRTLPPSYICANQAINYRHDAIYNEDYEIKYEFYTPAVAGGAENYYPKCCDCQKPDLEYCPPPFESVTYADGFSFQNPLGESSILEIDPNTGLLNGTPQQTGSYVIGIKATQYLNGIYISSTKRDFQFDIVACIDKVTAQLRADNEPEQPIHSPQLTINEYTLCNSETLVIVNESTDRNYIDHYSWSIWNTHGESMYNRFKSDEADLIVTDLEPGEYNGHMIVNEDLLCSDTAQFKIRVLDDLHVDFSYDYDACNPSEVNLYPDVNINQAHIEASIWEFENGDIILGNAGAYLFDSPGDYKVRLTIKDTNKCSHSIEKTIAYYPNQNAPLIEEVETTLYLCENESIEFNGEQLDGEGTYQFTDVTTENTCDSTRQILHLIALPEPIVESHQKFICPNQVVEFNGLKIDGPGIYYQYLNYTDKSCDSIIRELIVERAILPEIDLPESINITASTDFSLPLNITGEYSSIEWQPAELLDCSDCENPSTQLNDSEKFQLAIQTIDGCELEYDLNVNVEKNIDFYLPNILSKKEGNDILFLQSKKEVAHNYNMYVYDRYGNLIHKSFNALCNNKADGWKPENINTGVYIYYIEFDDSLGLNALAGSVTKIK
jgi:hypothetical protein